MMRFAIDCDGKKYLLSDISTEATLREGERFQYLVIDLGDPIALKVLKEYVSQSKKHNEKKWFEVGLLARTREIEAMQKKG